MEKELRLKQSDEKEQAIKTFLLVRDIDMSGVSGVGVVACGVVFPTGKAVLNWLTETSSVAVYDSIEDLIFIHGHDGKTRVVYGNGVFMQ